MPNEIVKYRVRETGSEAFLPEDTVYVFREVVYKKMSQLPIYENGELLPDVILAEMGLEKVGFTQEQIDQEIFTGYYEINPTLAERVRQYAGLLAKYGLEPTANSDEITAAILSNETISAEEKDMDSRIIPNLIHDIELNFNEVTGNGLEAWNNLDKLLKYLPPLDPLAAAEQSEAGSDDPAVEPEEEA